MRLHPFTDRDTTRRQCLHLMNDLRQLLADLLHFVHAAPDLFREFVHAHDAGGHGGLNFLDGLLDVVGRDTGLIGEPSNFGGHDRKATAGFTRLLRLDCGIE